jgi:threonine/homoserine/homoserine lactone efflux protein
MELFYFIQFFIISGVISFFGSLQLGPVNMSVIYTAINKDHRSAVKMAIGGSLPELFYSAAAFWFSDILQQFPMVMTVINYAIAPIFILVGIFLFFQKVNTENKESNKSKYPFSAGFILGSLNPMLLPFWIFVIEFLRNYHIYADASLSSVLGFIAGTTSGAFLLLYLVAYYIHRKKKEFRKNFLQNANRITGGVFILIGLAHLYRFLF